MKTPPAILTRLLVLLLRLIILVLAGLLIFHHSLMLYDMYLGAGNYAHTFFDYVQSVCRVLITTSLLLVVFGVRRALWGMWFSIGALVATQYWVHFGNFPVYFTDSRHPLAFLKGFIFPTIITLAFHYSSRPSDSKERHTHSLTPDAA